ncbi:hypothetical protein C8Q74DRAFT_966817 [Fomes fomentarius]|nr:hypothetical protein C8Q74DRAFT_966817 [Fomes fomentarius]
MDATGPVPSRDAVPPRQSDPTRIPMGFSSVPHPAHIADRAVTSPTRGDPSSMQLAKPPTSTMPTPIPTSVHPVAPPSMTGNRSRSTASEAQSTSTLVSPASSSIMMPPHYSSYHQVPRSRPPSTQTPTTSATVVPLASSAMSPPAYVPRSPRVAQRAERVDSTPAVAPLISSTMPVSIDTPCRLGTSKSSIHSHASKVVLPYPSPSTDVPQWPDIPECPINGVPSMSAVRYPVSPSTIPPPTSIGITAPSQVSVQSSSMAPVSSSSPPKGNILRTSTAASSAQAILMSSNSAPEQSYSNATLDSLLDPMYASSSMTGSVQLVPVDPSMASTDPSTGVGTYLMPVRNTETLSDGILWTPYEQHDIQTAISVAEIREIVARYIPNPTFSEAVIPSTTFDSTSLPTSLSIVRRDSKCAEMLVPSSSDAFVTDPHKMDIPVATTRPTKSMPLHYHAGLPTIMASGPRGESPLVDPPRSHQTSSTHVTSFTARAPTPTSTVVPLASSASTLTASALQAIESSQRLVQLPSPQNAGVREMSPFFGYDVSVPPAPSPKNDTKFMFFTLDIAQTASSSSSFSIRATASPPPPPGTGKHGSLQLQGEDPRRPLPDSPSSRPTISSGRHTGSTSGKLGASCKPVVYQPSGIPPAARSR